LLHPFKQSFYVFGSKTGNRPWVYCVLFVLLFSLSDSVNAQSHPPMTLPMEHGLNRQQERKEIDAGMNIHRAVRPRIQLPDTAEATGTGNWLLRKAFHEHLFEFKQPDWSVKMDLLADLSLGRDLASNTNTWLNTRGFWVQGN